MTNIVDDATEWLEKYSRRDSTHSDVCHRWHDACLVARLVAKIDELEREVAFHKGAMPRPKRMRKAAKNDEFPI